MEILTGIKSKIENDGFAVINTIFSSHEIDHLLLQISKADQSRQNFCRTNDLFAIRQFFKEVPDSIEIIFQDKLNEIVSGLFGDEYFVIKSIYFDKPENSNWSVAYHQDLTISVNKKMDLEGFGLWTTKQGQFAVQPPLNILIDNFTIRIHLDDTTEANGALNVIPGSHLKGICRLETIDWAVEEEAICAVQKGGIMFMKPLLLHSSRRTKNNNKRRVLHIEFSRSRLPENLSWSECLALKFSS